MLLFARWDSGTFLLQLQWNMSFAIEPRSFIQSAQNPNVAFASPCDATHKIISRLADLRDNQNNHIKGPGSAIIKLRQVRQVNSMQRIGTEAIRTNIQPISSTKRKSKPFLMRVFNYDTNCHKVAARA